MASKNQAETETKQAQFACAACEYRSLLKGSGAPRECPRCAAAAIIVSTPDGSLVVPEAVREARSLAVQKDIPVGFALAVIQKRLTVEQAKTKGNRKTVAKRIADRHEIPLRMAYQVADGRIPIQEALERAVSPAAPSASRGSWRVYAWFVAAILVLLVGVVRVKTPAPETPIDPNARDDSAAIAKSRAKQVAKLERNEQNQIISLEGRSPKDVLNLYCANVKGEAVEINKVNTNRVQAVFEKQGHRYAFDIHYDTSEKIWFAGGTGFPIPVKPVRTE